MAQEPPHPHPYRQCRTKIWGQSPFFYNLLFLITSGFRGHCAYSTDLTGSHATIYYYRSEPGEILPNAVLWLESTSVTSTIIQLFQSLWGIVFGFSSLAVHSNNIRVVQTFPVALKEMLHGVFGHLCAKCIVMSTAGYKHDDSERSKLFTEMPWMPYFLCVHTF